MHCVFFFGKGVLHATGPEKQLWSDWSRSVGARLVLCSASAETFGLAADDDFSVEGLGELIEAGLTSGKVVSLDKTSRWLFIIGSSPYLHELPATQLSTRQWRQAPWARRFGVVCR